MSVSYRTVERPVGETGIGVDDRVEVEHQIGATIDGVFVPFATIADGRVEVLKRAEEDRVAAEKAAADNGNTARSSRARK